MFIRLFFYSVNSTIEFNQKYSISMPFLNIR